MKPKTLFDYARLESFRTELGEAAPSRDGLPALKSVGRSTEAANTQRVDNVMREARQAVSGRQSFRALLRALRG